MATNNEAEYKALLVGMTIVQKIGGKIVEIFSNSRLVVGQVKGELEARDVRMQEYLNQVRCLPPYCKSLGAGIHMLILLPLSQPPQCRAYFRLSLLKTCANLLR